MSSRLLRRTRLVKVNSSAVLLPKNSNPSSFLQFQVQPQPQPPVPVIHTHRQLTFTSLRQIQLPATALSKRFQTRSRALFYNYSTSTNPSGTSGIPAPAPKPKVNLDSEFNPGLSPSASSSSPQPVKVKETSESIASLSPLSTESTVMGNSENDAQKAMSLYVLPLDQPVVNLDCLEAFNGLTDQEKLYAHYLSQASWFGGLVVLAQTSPEAPLTFNILHDMFKSNGVEGLKSTAINEAGFTEDEWKSLVVYTSGVFCNMGNYKGFGDTKFIPGVPLNKLSDLISKAKFLGLGNDVKCKWDAVKDKIYSLSDREKQLGLGEKGITTYFSDNCTKEDSALINRFLKENKLEAWNTRCFKKTEGANLSYEIRSASAKLDGGSQKSVEFEGANIKLTVGDYAPLMQKLAENLEKAKAYASNDTEKNMIDCYIKSFVEGSLDEHKNGSRFWIKDKGPAIETYIGFIENYRDPTGVRAEFEGFVAVMNRNMSKKFNVLVEKAPDFLKLLPWPAEFEKDKFMKPDFTSLDVLTFAGSGIPAGINIPNYDEIRQNEGFKNVSLGNVIPASYKDAVIPFLSEEDKDLLNKYRVPSFEVQVALHELLGHGSGKLLKKEADGTTNYPADLKNPLSQQLVEHVYDADDTYDSVFGDIGSSFEECRAECVGLLLSLDKTILSQIFGHEDEEAENIIYANWLSMIFAGAAKALEMYQPKTKSWMQAHSHARFAILQVLIEAGEGLVTIQETKGTDGKPDLLISLDRTKIDSVGKKAIADFLLKIQVYKATADINSARKMFSRYTDVNNDGKHPWATWRDIVMDKKQPRKLFVQHNTVVSGETVTTKSYDASPEGVVQSWIERFPDNSIYPALDYCWTKDKPYF